MAHVLLLEPNTLLARTYTQALQQMGHSVAAASGAQQAIQAADMHQPDVVVVELQLPSHNGIEFLHEFRSYPEWQHVPVVVNTTLPPVRMQRHVAALQQNLGVTTILYKPTATLADIVRAVQAEVVTAG